PAGRADPLGRDGDLRVLERLHGRRRALRRAIGERGPERAVSARDPNGDEVAFAGLRGQATLLARGQVTSRELVALTLDAIESTQECLNAFRCTRPAAALAAPERADRRP